MKSTRNILTAALLTTLALAACTSEDDVQNNTLPEGTVRITATIGDIQTRSPLLAADGSGTFGTDDQWGMYTFTGDAANPTYSNENISYAADGSSPLYWEDLGEGTVTFSAYYPRRLAWQGSGPTEYTFASTGTDLENDLLAATATASKGGTVALNFKHLMHRLVVNLTSGSGVVGNLNEAFITIIMKSMVKVNLIAATVDPATAEGNIKTTHYGASCKNTFVPQDMTEGEEWIKITLGEDTYIYKVPASLKSSDPAHSRRLESGKQLTLNLTLKKGASGQTEVELTSSDITAWGTQGTIDDDVVIGGGDTQAAYNALTAAIAGATSTDASNPDQITLTGDIDMGDNEYFTIGANGTAQHIVIDGNGNKITLGSYISVLNVQNGSTFTLKNITIDGDNDDNGSSLVTADETSTVTLDDGAVLQNLKNATMDVGGTLYSIPAIGVSLRDNSTLIMNSGASIKDVEGYAISSDDDIFNRIIFNGGSLSGSLMDIYIEFPSTTEASIQISSWPTLDGDREMNVLMGYEDTDVCMIAAPINGYSSLSLDDFNFNVYHYNGGGDITNQCDIYLDTDGIIKIKPKPAP